MAQADPTVNGTVISWPDDGWYQVQSTDGATTLCSGGSSCTVTPGRYLVINHTLGIRYTDVQVSGIAAISDGIQVSENTISWPDDGWYQVQSMDGATTYCNGGRSCTVDAGAYLVINHTTGQRVHDVIVGTKSLPSEIVVNGQRISWPDDGWYQVQTANGVESLCNGGRYCDVEPGSYLVINHTTGVRFQGIEVTDESPIVDPPVVGASGTINRDNHIEILSQVFSVYTGTAFAETLPGLPEEFMDSHVETELNVTDEILSGQEHGDLNQYACDNGGTLDYLWLYGSYENDNRIYTWDNCLDGTVVRDGFLKQTTYSYGSFYRQLATSVYSAEYANGEKMDVSGRYGETFESYKNPNIRRIDRWENEGLDFVLQNDTPILAVSNANTYLSYSWLDQTSAYSEPEDDEFSAFLDGSFQLSSALTDYENIDVATTESLSVKVEVDGTFDYSQPYSSSNPPDYPAWTFTKGALEVMAEDGSGLRLLADSGDVQSVEISLMQDGDVVETIQQPWSLWWEVLTDVQDDPRGDLYGFGQSR